MAPQLPRASKSARQLKELVWPRVPAEHWQAKGEIALLQGSQEYFPALVAAMEAAQRAIYFETYIFDTTGSGAQVAHALMAAAARGVAVYLVVDGFGTRALTADWRLALAQAGVQMLVFSPPTRWFLLAPRQWQRLHRKLCAIDDALAFCGGINVLDDFHDPHYGTLERPRLDFPVRLTGSVAQSIARACHDLWQKLDDGEGEIAPDHEATGGLLPGIQTAADTLRGLGRRPGQAALLLRDNLRQRRSIERSYLRAIAKAKDSVVIANAYFFPSRKLLAALLHAARRGVSVQLLLQGRYEYFLQYHATRAFYRRLLGAGVRIYEYEESFLHAKVAVVDAHLPSAWATVGSSNLDPLSLLLAKEANVVTRQRDFAKELQGRLEWAMALGHAVRWDDLVRRSRREQLFDRLAYALARAMVWLVKDHF